MVAVIGAFGFLGRRLLQRLEVETGIERVVAVDVRSAAALVEGDADLTSVLRAHPRLSAHTIDLTMPGADRELQDVFAGERVDSVIHAALLSTPTHALEMAHELETIGTLYVHNAAVAAGVRHLTTLSSAMCYGARPDNPAWITEEQPLRPPASRALRDRAEVDSRTLQLAVDHPEIATAVVRLGAMAPTARDHFWTRILSRPVVPAVLGFDPLLQLLHPDDAIDGILAVWRARASGPFNVVGRGVLPLSHILSRLGRVPLYLPAPVGSAVVSALWSAQLVEMPKQFLSYLQWGWVCDDRRIHDATGFVPAHDIHTVLSILAASQRQRR